MQAIIRMGVAGNGVPVFMTGSQFREMSRPFGASFDASRSLWLYPAYFPAARKVLADFKIIDRDVKIEFSDAAAQYIKQLEDVEARYNAVTFPEGFNFVTEPFEHQRVGLAHIFYMLRAALFYAPGLGKSKCAVDLFRLLHFTGQRKVKIVMGPLVTIKNWGKEIDRHSGGALTWGAVLGTKKQKTKVIEAAGEHKFDVLLVTYDTARNFTDLIFKLVDYDTIVADESHRIKSWTSAATKAAHEIGQKAVRKILMTGTPTLGNPLDLYGQFKFLGDYFMPENYVLYKSRYLETAPANKHVILGYKNLDVLNDRTQFLAIRKSKEECLDLPPRTVVDIEYDLSPHQAVIYNELITEMGIIVEKLIEMLQYLDNPDHVPPEMQLAHGAVLLHKLRQVSSGFIQKSNMDPQLCDTAEEGGCRFKRQCVFDNIKPYSARCQVQPKKIPPTITVFDDNPKLDAVEELLDSLLADPTAKVLIWAEYTTELDIVEGMLKRRAIAYVRVDGSNSQQAADIVDDFNGSSTLKVYLAQVSTGISITINSATYSIYYGLTYKLEMYLQSRDRNLRIGQTRNVTEYRMLGRQTIEPSMVKLLDAKIDLDIVMTRKLTCLPCVRCMQCMANDVKLFDDACIYQRNMARPVTRVRLIHSEGGS